VLRVDADYPYNAFAADDLTIFAYSFDAAANLHVTPHIPNRVSLVPVRDPPLGQVVGANVHGNLISRQNAYVMHAHLAGNVGNNFVVGFKLDPEHCIGQRFKYFTADLDFFFLSQYTLPTISEHFCTICGNGNGVLVMGRGLPICCFYRPTVIQRDDLQTSQVAHWLNGQHHTFT